MAKITSEWNIPVIEMTPELNAELRRNGIHWKIHHGYIVPTVRTLAAYRYNLRVVKHSEAVALLISEEYSEAIRQKLQEERLERQNNRQHPVST